MKAGNYLFQYRSQLDGVLCWKRVHCNTMEDIKKTIYNISIAFGQVEEWEAEMTNEEWFEMKRLHEEQERNEA